jgi:hypothetical protein
LTNSIEQSALFSSSVGIDEPLLSLILYLILDLSLPTLIHVCLFLSSMYCYISSAVFFSFHSQNTQSLATPEIFFLSILGGKLSRLHFISNLSSLNFTLEYTLLVLLEFYLQKSNVALMT